MLGGSGMTTITLAKLHATGNDFLVLTALDGAAEIDERGVVALCDRHTGIGADGLITLGPPRTHGADCSFSLRNAAGGAAEMSGNGMRCLARVAAHTGLGARDRLVVDTAVGVREVALTRDGRGEVDMADVDMGPPTFEPSEIPVVA